MTFSSSLSGDGHRIYSVSGFAGEVRSLLETSYPEVWIEGEISNLATPASGHCYFSIKDKDSQIRCALFRQRRMRSSAQPAEGKQVLIRAKVSLYPARGDFQLIVDYMEDAGEGALRRTMEELKRKLQGEGLFNEQHKQRLPALPCQLGVITSASGAALKDILSTLERLCPLLPVVVYPTLVQGSDAPANIVQAIEQASKDSTCDTLIIARGGGSLEDLMAFNQESVAHAIHACTIPVISGVGHETDTTICDFVSDIRAPTPTGAAEIIARQVNDWLENYLDLGGQINVHMEYRLNQAMQNVDNLASRLRHPSQGLKHNLERLDFIQRRLLQGMIQKLQLEQSDYRQLGQRLVSSSPAMLLPRQIDRIKATEQRLITSMTAQIKYEQEQLDSFQNQLRHLNPRNVIQRGFAVLKKGDQVVSSSAQAKPGDHLVAELRDGELDLDVT